MIMDLAHLTKIIFSRIQAIDPDNAIRTLGYIYVKDPNETEVLSLAYGSDHALLQKIAEAKATLGHPSAMSSAPVPHFGLGQRSFSSPQHLWDPQANVNSPEPYDPAFYYGAPASPSSTSSRHSRRSPSMPELTLKPCHYYYKGYCKHGSNCRYYHGPVTYDGNGGYYIGDGMNSEDVYGHSPLEKLEMEIVELLRSRGGGPVSIASLPMLYFERYNKGIQADGYLTESQRHGKAGYSLTKLLARLKNSIHLIDRPHGQHAVVLVEDAAKYMDCDSSSHQIYLTFPSESTFNDEDVCEYFSRRFGPVRDVRIPSQEKRMYAFVSFIFHETVSTILMRKNPHYIRGARVLVKPYREKFRIERSCLKPSMFYPPHCNDEPADSSSAAMQRETDHYSCYINRLLMDEQESMLEMGRNRFSELNISQNQLSPPGFDVFNFSGGPSEFPVRDHFSLTLDALNNNMVLNEENANNTAYSDQDSQIELPDSPFATSVVESTIAGVI